MMKNAFLPKMNNYLLHLGDKRLALLFFDDSIPKPSILIDPIISKIQILVTSQFSTLYIGMVRVTKIPDTKKKKKHFESGMNTLYSQ